eukprot:6594740-Pyramimonas_sp.AAC.1
MIRHICGGVVVVWLNSIRDQGCLGMKLGEIRKLDIPADEGCAKINAGPSVSLECLVAKP